MFIFAKKNDMEDILEILNEQQLEEISILKQIENKEYQYWDELNK